MAKKTISPIEQHLEKGVLGLAAAALLVGAVYYFILGTPYAKVIWTGEAARPDQLAARLEQAARAADERWKGLPAPPPPSPLNLTPNVENPFNLARYPDVLQPAPAAQPFPPPLIEGDSAIVRKARPLVAAVAPLRPLVKVQRNVLLLPARESLEDIIARPGPLRGGETPLGKEKGGVHWAAVAATLDLDAQKAAFQAAQYPPEAWDLAVFDLDVQRRVVTETISGQKYYGPWERANLWTPHTPLEAPRPAFAADGALAYGDREALNSLFDQLRLGQRWILRPDPLRLDPSDRGDKVVDPLIPYLHLSPAGFYDELKPLAPPEAELQRQARLWKTEAEKLMRAGPSELAAAYFYAEAAYWSLGLLKPDRDIVVKDLDQLDSVTKAAGGKPPPRKLRRYMPVLAYDLQLQPNCMYQWRVRLHVFNRYAGHPLDLARVEDVRRIVVSGEWSAPSEPPTDVWGDMGMFLVRAQQGRPEVAVDVFRISKSHRGTRKQYTVRIGESIGRLEKTGRTPVDFSTSAVVVDIDPAAMYRTPGSTVAPEPTTSLVYTDIRDPSVLGELILARDVNDVHYRELTSNK